MLFHHRILLDRIIASSGKGTQHTSSDSYLGNTHPRYLINLPTLRSIAKEWMKTHQTGLRADEFCALLTSLMEGESSTEKVLAGLLLDYSSAELRKFDVEVVDQWLTHLQGWAEVDTLCTGVFAAIEIPNHFTKWKKLLLRLSMSSQIEKRRASLVLLCSPLASSRNEQLVEMAFQNIQRLMHEKEVMITKAISWVLRSAVKHHKKEVADFLKLNSDSLPKIAVRETRVKLATGKKTKPKLS